MSAMNDSIKLFLAVLGFLLPVPLVYASTSIKIATVPAEFTPYSGPGLPEPVSMSGYYFEVNEETARARVVVDYMYRDQMVFAEEDGHIPEPTYAQIPGLVYEPSTHAIVYERDGRKTVCAVVQERRSRFLSGPRVKPTGNCTVSAKTTDHAEDDGWRIRRFRAIDVYFDVQ
ncbi:MAG TPA: hypothetical protein VEV41_22275 [Terriglobales bacterium]|nr:hypothetical protein [Terriglobales bacterium]